YVPDYRYLIENNASYVAHIGWWNRFTDGIRHWPHAEYCGYTYAPGLAQLRNHFFTIARSNSNVSVYESGQLLYSSSNVDDISKFALIVGSGSGQVIKDISIYYVYAKPLINGTPTAE